VKSFRIPDDLYRAALAKAESEGRSLTEVVRECLEDYVAGYEARE
jgi:predicted HicB family RNase H-like nuclease